GHLAQVFLIAAGFIFNLGNMLLLAAASILGTAAAFPLSVGIALVVSALLNLPGNDEVLLISGMVLMIIAILLVGASWRVRDRAIKAASPKGAAGTLTNDLDGKPSVSAAAVGTARKV